MTPAIFLPLARADLTAAHAEYENRSAGLGDRFLRAVGRVVARIEGNPYAYGEVAPDVRAGPAHPFQHVVYYQIEPARVVVVAVCHGREDPAVWHRRV